MTAPKLRINIDWRPLVEDLNAFQQDELKKRISKETLRIARKIHRSIVKDYKSNWKGGSSTEHGDSIISGLTVRRIKNKISEMDNARLSTWGNRKKGSRSYYLSFFEVGTEERMAPIGRGKNAEKKVRRGKIEPKEFMNKRVNNTDISQELMAAIIKHVEQIKQNFFG